MEKKVINAYLYQYDFHHVKNQFMKAKKIDF